jgi:ABC-type arginine transport system permease subunit
MQLFGLEPDYLVSRKKKAKEEQELLSGLGAHTKLEKGDLLALILAASVTLLPLVIFILLLYYGISMLLFG